MFISVKYLVTRMELWTGAGVTDLSGRALAFCDKISLKTFTKYSLLTLWPEGEPSGCR